MSVYIFIAPEFADVQAGIGPIIVESFFEKIIEQVDFVSFKPGIHLF